MTDKWEPVIIDDEQSTEPIIIDGDGQPSMVRKLFQKIQQLIPQSAPPPVAQAKLAEPVEIVDDAMQDQVRQVEKYVSLRVKGKGPPWWTR